MEEGQLSVGQFFDRLIEEKTRSVVVTGNQAGYLGMLPDIVRRIKVEKPDLSAAEKECLRKRCQEFVNRFCGGTGRSRHDFTSALGSVAQILA